MRAWIIVFVACALAGGGSARAEEPDDGDVLYARVGLVSEGMQGTLAHGLELGGGWDVPLGANFFVGLGASFARQRDRSGFADLQERFLSFDVHARGQIGHAAVRPFFEVGLGYYRYDAHFRYPARLPVDRAWGAPGGSLGIGTQVRLGHAFRARIGVAHHLIVQSTAYNGGNLEDYFASGLTLEYVLP